MSYCYHFLETEQTASQARDVWKKKPALKQIQNKQQQLIKATKQKKIGHYQNKLKTLTNLEKPVFKKPRLDHLPSIEPAPTKIEPTTTKIDVEIIVDDIKSAPAHQKWFCSVCKIQYNSTASIYQHKKTTMHKNNEYLNIKILSI